MKSPIEIRELEDCGVCGNQKDFCSIFKLPNLPLTEAFGKFEIDFPNFDQDLIMCNICGHTQLKNQINSDFLYSPENYAFRAGNSKKSNDELNFLKEFVNDIMREMNVNHVLEIGANDLKFSKLLKKTYSSVTACDPLLQAEHGKYIDGIQIIGLPVEKAVRETDFIKPDLVVARHTLEHISNPKLMINSLIERVNEDCVFIFEVPSLMHLVEALRFDAIFHQHYHYFDIESIKTMVKQLGLQLINFKYNIRGSNGGSLIFAVKKFYEGGEESVIINNNKFNIIRNKIEIFNGQMSLISRILDESLGPTYGFGASLMLATYDYHLGGRLQDLNCILDDDSEKDGLGYKNLKVSVTYSGKFKPDAQSSFIITSLESIRPIYNRVTQFNPRNIIVPLIT